MAPINNNTDNQETDAMNKRDAKHADKYPQDNASGLNSVQEIYHHLEDEFENSHSVKSQQNRSKPSKLCGSKRPAEMPDDL